MCTVLLPPGVTPIAVNKYIISDHHIIYHIIYKSSPLHHFDTWFERWAHGRPKHVEVDNYKYTKKNCTPSWFYLQDGQGSFLEWLSQEIPAECAAKAIHSLPLLFLA